MELISTYLAPYITATRRQYHAVMIEWWQWAITARVHLLAAQRAHIEGWIRHLRGLGYQKSTINTRLSVVCGFYRWAHEETLLPRDIGAFVRRPRRARRSRLKWLDAAQASDFLAASITAGPPWSGLAHLFVLNGTRRTETLEARIEHLERIDGHTTLHLPSRKGGVMDTISLPAPTITALETCIRDRQRGRIFLERGRAVTPARLYRALNSISQAADLGFPARPHMLRATFITLSLDAGIDPRDVMASAGHATVTMVAYYDRAHASIRRNASHRLAHYLNQT